MELFSTPVVKQTVKRRSKQERQDLAAIGQEVQEHPGKLRALFFNKGLLKDGILYASFNPAREPYQQTQVGFTLWKAKSPFSVWKAKSPLTAVIKNSLTTFSSAPSQAQLIQVFQEHTKWHHTPLDVKEQIQQAAAFARKYWSILHPPESWAQKDKKSWQTQCNKLWSKKLDLTGSLDEQALEIHCKAQAPLVWENLSKARRARLIKLLLASATEPSTREQWRDGPPRFSHFAELPESSEEELIKRLLAAGARVEDNQMELPGYRSQHKLEAGKRFSLELEDGTLIHYVPHGSVGVAEQTSRTHTLEFSITDQEKNKLLTQLGKHYGAQKINLEDYLEVKRGGRRRLAHRSEYDQATWRAMEKAADEEWWYKGEAISVPYEYQIADHLGLRSIGHNGLCLERHQAHEYELARAELHKCPADFKLQELELKGEDAEQALARLQKQINQKQFATFSHPVLRELVENKFSKRQVTPWASSRDRVEHRAPASERGQLRVEHADAATAVKHLNQLGITGALTAKVDYEKIYRGPRRQGRVHVLHPEYTEEKVKPKLKKNHMLLHGMTGVSTNAQALTRLDNIVEAGGLKSISERRRMNIAARSMSPKGDIASGIDMAVPCKVGDHPAYGANKICFAMRPEALKRRDLFFAPCDYGASKTRYDQYQKYARSIGQQHMYDPPDHQARTRHLNKGLDSSNEAWLKHEINWDEIDTVFVADQDGSPASGLVSQVKARIQKYQQQGLIPEHVRVEGYESSVQLAQQVKKRAQQVNN